MITRINQPFILAITGASGSGKTTLISKLINELKSNGYKVGVVKKSHHRVDLDKKGKDSFLLRESGASKVLLISDSLTTTIETDSDLSDEALLRTSFDHSFDFLIVESYKSELSDRLTRLTFDLTDSNAAGYLYHGKKITIESDKPLFDANLVKTIVYWLETVKNKSTNRLTHFDENFNPYMVDISAKSDSKRVAIAQGRALLSAGSLDLIKEKKFKKGDVISIATLAGITGAKQCSTLIPLCHQINLTSVKVNIEVDSKKNSLEVTSTVTTLGKTGVEMEALTAVSTALLTIYDMVKSVDKSVCLTDIRLIEKRGGKSGLFRANDS